MPHPHRTSFPAWLRRSCAAAGAVLVLALTVFSASPVAHRWLHELPALSPDATCRHHEHGAAAPTLPAHRHTDADAPEHSCAVVLFAHGLDLPVVPAAPLPPVLLPVAAAPVTAAELHLLAPRYLRHPERGPPASRLV